jgi:hypothetical protein
LTFQYPIKHAPGADQDAQNDDGFTPLLEAAFNDNLGRVEVLVENGADVNHRNNYGWSPLYSAITYGNDHGPNGTAIAIYLIKHGAHLDTKYEDDWTPLHMAISKYATSSVASSHDAMVEKAEYLKIITLLIAEEDDPKNLDAADVQGNTPLHMAAKGDLLDVLRLLCCRHPQATFERQGRISRSIHGCPKVSLGPYNCIRSLGDHLLNDLMGISGVAARRAGGLRVLYYPVRYPMPYASDLRNLNNLNNLNKTALMLAAETNLQKVACFLLKAGADPNIRDAEGKNVWNVANKQILSCAKEGKGDLGCAKAGKDKGDERKDGGEGEKRSMSRSGRASSASLPGIIIANLVLFIVLWF